MSLLCKFWHSLVFGALFCLPSAYASYNCHIYLSEVHNHLEISATDKFIAFSAALVDEGILSLDFLENLSNGHLENPFSKIHTKSEQSIYTPIFDAFLKADLDISKIKKWATSLLAEKKKVQEKRKQSQDETKETYIKIKFKPIVGGEVDYSQAQRRPGFITISYHFEMMETKVTQKMWFDLMKKFPSSENNYPEFEIIKIGRSKVKYWPNNPVDSITWWSAIEFANALSKSRGYPPAYDTSELIYDKKTSAAHGTLQVISGKLKINAPNGDITKAKGFRLPTHSEQVFVRTGRGQIANFKTHYFPGIDSSNIRDHVWFDDWDENAPYHSVPVAQFKPFVIDEKYFYDLYGNGYEWATDWWNEGVADGVKESAPTLCGASADFPISERKEDHENLSCMKARPNARVSSYTFRLVRTLEQ